MLGDRYPLNKKCAHPDCDKEAQSAHHIFGRPPPEGQSWFVEIDVKGDYPMRDNIIPHVVGLCGSGTTGHHGDVEEHRAWIKYEDGEFIWYEQARPPEEELKRWSEETGEHEDAYPIDHWEPVGPLDPQPGYQDKKRKRRTRLKGEERRKKVNLTIKVPKEETEDGAGLFYDAVEQLEEAFGHDPPRSVYYTLMDALNLALMHGISDD